MILGYARVSTDEQSVDAPVRQLRAAGCKKNLPREGERREAIKRRDQGEPVREIGRSYNVSHSTISRLTT